MRVHPIRGYIEYLLLFILRGRQFTNFSSVRDAKPVIIVVRSYKRVTNPVRKICHNSRNDEFLRHDVPESIASFFKCFQFSQQYRPYLKTYLFNDT